MYLILILVVHPLVTYCSDIPKTSQVVYLVTLILSSVYLVTLILSSVYLVTIILSSVYLVTFILSSVYLTLLDPFIYTP